MTRREKPEESLGVLAERQLPDGRRKIKLRKAERQALVRQRRAEAAAALFLDLEEDRTWKDIAEELELSPAQLRDLSKTEEFELAYSELFAEIGHDPRYLAAKGALSDMLPAAVQQLRHLLTAPGTADTVRFRAVEKILQLNGVKPDEQALSDRRELAKFLVEHHIRFDDPAAHVPVEYKQAMRNMDEPEVIEGEYTDSDDDHSDDSDEPNLLDAGEA